MEHRFIPTTASLRRMAEKIPQLDVSSVEVLLFFRQTAEFVQKQIFDPLEAQYNLSEGKLVVLILLFQSQEPLAPSALAAKAGVTRATISVMLRRMVRDNLVELAGSAADGRSKMVSLTSQGRSFVAEVLPQHYLRTSAMLQDFSLEEKATLLKLLRKLQK